MYCPESVRQPLETLQSQVTKPFFDFIPYILSGTVPWEDPDHRPINKCITAYSRRDLTKPEDGLNAILGVLNSLRTGKRPMYHLYGVAVTHRHIELAWHHKGKSSRRNIREVPTWSWVAWEGPVSVNGSIISSTDIQLLHVKDETGQYAELFTGERVVPMRLKTDSSIFIASLSKGSPTDRTSELLDGDVDAMTTSSSLHAHKFHRTSTPPYMSSSYMTYDGKYPKTLYITAPVVRLFFRVLDWGPTDPKPITRVHYKAGEWGDCDNVIERRCGWHCHLRLRDGVTALAPCFMDGGIVPENGDLGLVLSRGGYGSGAAILIIKRCSNVYERAGLAFVQVSYTDPETLKIRSADDGRFMRYEEGMSYINDAGEFLDGVAIVGGSDRRWLDKALVRTVAVE
ncbi:hypothetical protein F5883DRAFT_596078 [Diaporthe sp. PMI_573]|nr:hypothetical protein F5883DRAFT_596078 [Diaporthaceae sp. PMI_573]